MNAEQIRDFFEDYQKTLEKVDSLDVSIRTQHDWDAWCAALTERAKDGRRMLEDDTRLLLQDA